MSILRLSFLPHGLATRYLLEELESPRCYLSLVLFAFTCRFSASRYSGCLFDNILMLLGSSCTRELKAFHLHVERIFTGVELVLPLLLWKVPKVPWIHHTLTLLGTAFRCCVLEQHVPRGLDHFAISSISGPRCCPFGKIPMSSVFTRSRENSSRSTGESSGYSTSRTVYLD